MILVRKVQLARKMGRLLKLFNIVPYDFAFYKKLVLFL